LIKENKKMLKKNISTSSRITEPPLKRGIDSKQSKEGKFWNPKSPYPYWEIPKNKLLIPRTKELRKAGNLAEVLFWKTFKDKNKLGFDIDRQVIIGNYIVDFFIPELGLVFEIDGSSHENKVEYDAERDSFMRCLNLQVVRIPDIDIKNNLGSVYSFVLETIHKRKKKALELFPY
jgi:very-short-patch-repair endonuclease